MGVEQQDAADGEREDGEAGRAEWATCGRARGEASTAMVLAGATARLTPVIPSAIGSAICAGARR